MLFKELVLENFGSYYGRNIINLLPENGDISKPIVLIGGMNGGGKTTIMDAIRLALYGQRAQCSTRGNLSYSDFLNQCINNQVESEEVTRVELLLEHLTHQGWQELRIVRAWKKNLTSKDGKDTLGIYESEFVKDEALTNTWDEYIEVLLPLGISNLFLFDGEQVKELAQLDATPSTVVEAINVLLGLELSEKLAIDLDILVSRKRKEVVDLEQLATLEQIEMQLKQYQKSEKEAKKNLQALQKKLKIAQTKETDIQERFQREGGKIAAEKNQLDLDKQRVENELDKHSQLLREDSAGILPLLLISPLLKQAQVEGEKELKIEEAKIAKNVIEQRDNRLLAYLNNLALSKEQIEQIDFFLAQDKQALIIEEETWLNIDGDTVKNLRDLNKNQLPFAEKKVRENLVKIKEIEKKLDNLERQLAVAAPPEVYEQLAKELKIAQEERLKCQNAYMQGQKKCQEIEILIKQTKKELENYSYDAMEWQNAQHLIDSVAKVKETLALFKEKLTLSKLNKLETEVTECFRYLLRKSDLVNRVVIANNTYNISLYEETGKIVPKNRLSAGEKQLLAIAFLWSLARVSGKNLPIAIDTPLSRLDSSHRHHLLERYFPTASHQVILLSTDTEIGKDEIEMLRKQEAIAREILLEYDAYEHRTKIKEGYFW